jgi:hypothetical protein
MKKFSFIRFARMLRKYMYRKPYRFRGLGLHGSLTVGMLGLRTDFAGLGPDVLPVSSTAMIVVAMSSRYWPDARVCLLRSREEDKGLVVTVSY